MGRPHSYLVPWEPLQSNSNKPECTSGSAATQAGGIGGTFQEEARSRGFGGAKERGFFQVGLVACAKDQGRMEHRQGDDKPCRRGLCKSQRQLWPQRW